MSDRLYTAQEVADFLCVSLSYVRHLSLRGEIAYIKVGRAVRYSRDDIDRWVAGRRMPARTEIKAKAKNYLLDI